MGIEVYHRDRTIHLVQRAQDGQHLEAKAQNIINPTRTWQCGQLCDRPQGYYKLFEQGFQQISEKYIT